MPCKRASSPIAVSLQELVSCLTPRGLRLTVRAPQTNLNPLFPVSCLLVVGGLLTNSSLFAQDNQSTKIPDHQWINLPDFSTQQGIEPQVYVTAKPGTPAVFRALTTHALAVRP